MAVVSPSTPWRDIDQRIDLVAVGAINLWHQYCRQYFLSCALGTADGGGLVVSNASGTFVSEGAAMAWARTEVAGSEQYLGEPRWRDPAVWFKVMNALRSSAMPGVILASGLPTDAFSNLPAFRNFYAHRCRRTALRTHDFKARHLVRSGPHPTDILRGARATTKFSVIEDWLDEIYAAIDLTV
jgi:hypothetical protein